MGRYKKVVTGEVELREVGGEKFLIYPTLETRAEMLELIQAYQRVDEVDEKDDEGNIVSTKRTKGGSFRIKDVANVCAKMVFEACWEHDGKGRRLRKKDGEEDTSFEDILSVIYSNEVLTIYGEILTELGVLDKEKFDAVKRGEGEDDKKKEEILP